MIKKTIIITGGLGFIGTNLVKKLEKKYKLIIIDNLCTNKKKYCQFSKNNFLIKKDINKKIKLPNRDIYALIHLAAKGSVIDSIQNPSENFLANTMGTFKVLEICKDYNIKKVIIASTGGAIMGNQNPPVDENSLPKPISPYGASKLSAEAYCSAYAYSYGISITALRFSNILGPYSWHKKGVITKYFKSILDKKPLVIYGDGDSTRDYLYVEDLCDGILKTLKKKLVGFEVLHLSSGKETSINNLIKKIFKITNTLNLKVIKKKARNGEVNRNFSLNIKAKKKINFKPRYSLDKALIETWKWFKDFSINA